MMPLSSPDDLESTKWTNNAILGALLIQTSIKYKLNPPKLSMAMKDLLLNSD